MNVEDTIIAKKKKKYERLENGYIHHLEQGPRPKKAKNMGEKGSWWEESKVSSRRYSNYTPLNTLLD